MDEVKELQKQINEWHSRNFPTQRLAIDQVVLTEEVGELSRAIAKMDQRIRGTDEEWLIEAYKEIGDVLIALSSVASELGIDLASAWTDRWKVISKRDWNKDKVQHGIEVA
jgi:NTP pyrophosphatase (non-canonical NTP hydrolase)